MVLDRKIRAPHIYSILIDNFVGAFTATQALITSGCEEVYPFSGSAHSYDNQKRHEGYIAIAALVFCKMPINSDFIITSDFTKEVDFEQMTNLLKSGVFPPLTTVTHHKREMGLLAANSLFSAMANGETPDTLKIIPTTRITRDTI